MAVATKQPKAQEWSLTPAQLAGYFKAKLAAEWGPHNLKRALDEHRTDIFVLDVRTRERFREGHIPGAVNIPFEELQYHLKELPKHKIIVAYCWDVTCLLSAKAAWFLATKGFRSRELLGGIEEWRTSNFPIATG